MPAGRSSSYLVCPTHNHITPVMSTIISKVVIYIIRLNYMCFFRLLESAEWNHIEHSLDVWHKTKKIPEVLGPESKKVAYRSLGPWLRAIVNHFWWACGACKGSKERLRALWLSILGHVCNDHTWATGGCQHPLPANLPDGKTWLGRQSAAYKLLRFYCLLSFLTYD